VSLPKPRLDSRTFAQLKAEGIGQISRLAPAWTDYNESDPGITLLELFAWLSEQNLYRTDRVPPAFTRAFLRLVGITPRPAQVAEAVLLLSSKSGAALSAPTALQVCDAAAALVFETQAATTVSSAHLVTLLVGAATLTDVSSQNCQACTSGIVPQGFLPFGAAPAPGVAFYLGFDAALGAAGGDVSLYVWTPTPAADAMTRARLIESSAESESFAACMCPDNLPTLEPWQQHYSVRTVWEYFSGAAGWLPLPHVTDETRALTLSGFVRFAIPTDHVSGTPQSGWFIRCRYLRGTFDCAPRLMCVGVNAVAARHAAQIPAAEVLGASLGHASETYTTSRAPVVPGSTTLILAGGLGGDTSFTETLSWDTVGAHDHRYLLEPATGTVTSGNGLFGAAFAEGWSVELNYRIGGGAAGNIAAGTLANVAQTPWNSAEIPALALLTAQLGIAQPHAALGGAEAETLAQAEVRAIQDLSRPVRSITLKDFEALSLGVPGVPVGVAKALPNHHPLLPCVDAVGSITVIVVPDCCGPAPVPSADFLAAVKSHLNPLRPVTTEVHVIGPTYVTVIVSATLQLTAGTSASTTQAAALSALAAFFNPLTGGPLGHGWPIGRGVFRAEIMTLLAALPGVSTVTNLSLQAGTQPATCGNLELCPDDLVASGSHAITVLEAAGAVTFQRSPVHECH
jgi:predicted phage baseplate assembly protein